MEQGVSAKDQLWIHEGKKIYVQNMCCIARADWTILYSIIISVLNYWWTAFIKVSNWPFSEHEHRPAHSTRITCHSVKRPLGSKKILMCRERSCFSKLCPSNIYRSCVRFGKLQAEYSPPPGVPRQTSSHFRMVSFDVICLKTDISTTTWCGEQAGVVYILWFCFNPLGAPDAKGLLHGKCSENGDHI